MKEWLSDTLLGIGKGISSVIPGYREYWNKVTGGGKHFIAGPNEGKSTPYVGKKDVEEVQKPNTSDIAGQLAAALGGSGGGSGGGGGVANKIDMTPYINSLKEGAAANKKTISDSYAAQRNQLSQALKAYQENTATARRQAMDAYNSARADLEEDAYMNMRAAQQSAASRGLGGSGLQQLAQLSSQIESGKQTSDLSKENTETQNELTKALKDYENQVNTSISDLNTEERNKITEIDKNTASAIAQAQYQEEVRYQEALAEAAARNAAYASQGSSTLSDVLQILGGYDNSMDAAVAAANEEFGAAKRDYRNKPKKLKKAVNEVYDNYSAALSSIYADSDYSALLGSNGRQYYDYYSTQLKNAYNKIINGL